MRREIVGCVLAAAAMVGILALSVPARQDGRQERPLRHDAAAIVKLVPVRVLSPEGRPMAGLRKEDFSLFEDGQRRTITEFEVHAITGAGMTVMPQLPEAPGPAVREGGAMGRKIFFFLDQQASDEAGRVKARTAALRFLDTQIRPGDEVAVIGFYAMSGFFIREYLTSDMRRIRRAINASSEAPPTPGEWVGPPDDSVTVRRGRVDVSLHDSLGGQGLDTAVTGALKGTDISRGGAAEGADDSPGGGLGGVFAPGTAAFQRLDFVPRMEDMVEVFKTIAGQKSLVLFTSRDLGLNAERLGRILGAAGTTVFVVMTQDWKLSPMGGMKVHFIWEDHSLKELAAASGGKYFADINEVEAIAQDLQSLTGDFYVLGYYVQETWEGKYHKIRVEVARPEARVLVQDGYADPKPFAQMSSFEKDIQLIDLAWADRPVTPFQSLSVYPLTVLEDGGAQACLLTRLEVDAKSGVPPGRNEIFAFLRDERGVVELSRRWEIDLSPYAGKSLLAYAIVPISPGTHDYRFIIRDLANGEACIGRASFDVAVTGEAGIRVSSPLLFEEGAGTPYMRLPGTITAAGKKKAASEPSLIDLYGLVPKEGRLVAGEISHGVRKLTAILPYRIRPAAPDDEPILSVEVKLVARPGGGESAAAVSIREHRAFRGRSDILVVEISLPAVTSGSYDMEISLEDVGMDRRGIVRLPLLVR